MPKLEAFLSADFRWVRGLRSVWSDPADHVDALNGDVADAIFNDFTRATRNYQPDDSEPVGQVVVGTAGSGKTHLVGELRRRVWKSGGWFILVDLIGVKDFWASTALSFFNSLQAVMPDGQTQHYHLVHRLSVHLNAEKEMHEIATRKHKDKHGLVAELATLFVRKLSKAYTKDANEHRDVLIALILLLSKDNNIHDIAYYWLQGQNISEAEDAKRFGFQALNDPLKVVKGVSWIMSLVAPTMIAIDQIDAIVSATNSKLDAALLRSKTPDEADAELERAEAQSIVDALAQGFMDLHDVKRRAVTVLSCLEATWKIVEQKVPVSVVERFKSPYILESLPSAEIARSFVAARLAKSYDRDKFTPEFPTWPFTEAAFNSAVNSSPRRILMACEAHRLRCEKNNEIILCNDLFREAPPVEDKKNIGLDSDFAARAKCAVIDDCFGDRGDEVIADLLDDALRLYESHLELPENIDVETQRHSGQANLALLWRLKFIFHTDGDSEQHHCFLPLGKNNAIAFQTRLHAAMTESGVARALSFRHLYVLRNSQPPGGARTKQLVDQFQKAGGRFVEPSEKDLRIFAALRAMAAKKPPHFESWLRARKPLFETELFKIAGLCPPAFLTLSDRTETRAEEALPAAPGAKPATPAKTAAQQPVSAPEPVVDATSPQPGPELASIPIGRRMIAGGEELSLKLGLLPRHTAIIAGPGSGKTVLLRRIVEEAALLGCPAIVLDINNDLARLGDAWETPPAGFDETDAAKAQAYLKKADVVIWTPGVSSGNPLNLRLLPDFSAVKDAPDELTAAVQMAQATLEAHIATGGGGGAALARGVLADALRIFATSGVGGDLNALAALLGDLPEEACRIDKAVSIGKNLANQLYAAIAVNPLLQQNGVALVDIGALYASSAGRARISVINLAGIGSETARQTFVNQLQMALFSWIKQNPSKTPRLYVLDEAQNYAPSGKSTPCKASTLALAAQARKYGLGMIFATQLPRGIDNGLVSNCLTHVYGRMAAPATIQAIQELMAAKGGGGSDIGRMNAGEFYFSTEGMSKPVKTKTRMCLSSHPTNPPTAEEIAKLARQTRPEARFDQVSGADQPALAPAL